MYICIYTYLHIHTYIHILDINTLSDTCLQIFFLLLCGLPFHSFIFFFDTQSLNFDKAQFVYFLFCCLCISCISKKSLLNPRHKDFFLSSKSFFIVFNFILRSSIYFDLCFAYSVKVRSVVCGYQIFQHHLLKTLIFL